MTNLNAKVEVTPYERILNVRWTEEALIHFVELWNINRVRNKDGDIVTLSFERKGDDVELTASLPYGRRTYGSAP